MGPGPESRSGWINGGEGEGDVRMLSQLSRAGGSGSGGIKFFWSSGETAEGRRKTCSTILHFTPLSDYGDDITKGSTARIYHLSEEQTEEETEGNERLKVRLILLLLLHWQRISPAAQRLTRRRGKKKKEKDGHQTR